MFQAFNLIFWVIFAISTIFIVGMIVFIIATVVKGKKTLGSTDMISQTFQNVNEAIKQQREALKPWTCPYCGTENEANVVKCSSCSAKRKVQKEKNKDA